MRSLAAALLVSTAFAGCLAGPAAESVEAQSLASSNPWEEGLASEAETPEIAVERSRDERRATLAPPGDPAFAAFDKAMEGFMDAYGIPTASVAVVDDGRLRYESGYGHLDEAGANAAGPDAMFRIASVTKPMTAAVVTMMVEEGRFAWDDPVFCVPPSPDPDCLLPIEPHPARPVADDRLGDIQLRHLIEHRVGWTRPHCSAPIFGDMWAVAETFDVPTPPPAWRYAQWMMGEPLDVDPGTERHYCNVGYVMLGLVAEAALGVELPALYEAYLFRPLEVTGDIERGFTLPEKRNPREPFYACDYGETRSVHDPTKRVCWPDGGFDIDNITAAGGLVSTASAVAAVYDVYDIDGSPRPAEAHDNGHTGGIPGTATTAWTFSDGGAALGQVTIVVLFNKQAGPEPVLDGSSTLTYAYQLLYAQLLVAYEAAEQQVPG